MDRVLQYVPIKGIPELRSCITDLQLQVHSPPRWDEREILPINGATDAVCKVAEMVMEKGTKNTFLMLCMLLRCMFLF